ncbi:MAG: 1-acyl-sn-glycerol-3-phosphate acyltransferase [Phenylobacterium sp.]|jgi:1-acyl-sn-glycerol-3-phosphate acyltransferase
MKKLPNDARYGKLLATSEATKENAMSSTNEPSSGQFALLKTRRFLPFFLTQALGALNDNVFKNALMLIMLYSAADALPWDMNLVMNLAALLFILPFFIFSASAGDLADRIEKSRLIRFTKLAEIVIMLLAMVAFWFEQYLMLLGILFLMGTQSAFFGPVKYAILPQLVKHKELIGANALVEMGTFLAILAGTITGGILAGREGAGLDQAWIGVSACIIPLACIGYFVSRQIPSVPLTSAPSTTPAPRWKFRPISQTINAIKIARQERSIFLSIMAISWFWFLGASYLTQFPSFAKNYLGGDQSVVTLLLVAFSVGVAVGSLLCERLSGNQIELGIVPIGSIGLTIFGIDLFFASPQILPETVLGLTAFLEQSYAWRVLIDLTFIGAFGGFFIVPLYALLQSRAKESERAKVIAANNIFNALFMVASAIAGIVFLTIMELTIPQYFFTISVMNVVVAIYVYRQLPEFVLRFFIWILGHTVYRMQHKGLDHIPETGPAVLVCNHVSFVDSMLIAGAVRRPLRFVMDRRIYNSFGMNWLFKMALTIPICAKAEDEEVYENAFTAIKQVLEDGEVLCIFPEGKLTRDGNINLFKAGINRIIEASPVPVVPMAIQGLWGSFFSYHGDKVLKRTAKRFWSKITLIADAPIAPEQATAENLELKVRELRGEFK